MATKITLTYQGDTLPSVDSQIRLLVTDMQFGLKLNPTKCTVAIPKDAILPDKYKLGEENKVYGFNAVETDGDRVELSGVFNIKL